MSRGTLRFGALGTAQLNRSGLRWLRGDGEPIAAGEPIAFCNVALVAGSDEAFGEEGYDLQAVLASPVAGRLRHAAGVSQGGFVDRLPREAWIADQPWARIEGTSDGAGADADLAFLAGRRFTDLAEVRSGLLTGWHDRARAWRADGVGTTLIGAGTCEQDAILRGEGGWFGETLAGLAGPAQIVLAQDEPIVPCAAVLTEQIARDAAEVAAIRADVARSFAVGPGAPDARDWLFLGAFLNALERAPLAEDYALLTRAGVERAPPAQAICLSLTAELPFSARHRRLGYTINCHNFRLIAAGRRVQRWLREAFEPFARSVDDVARDYRALAAACPGRRLFVINQLSTPAYERIQSYRGLDDATMSGLGSVRAKEMNLMLHDLEREIGLVIVDADAIAADMGMAAHVPDGVHGSGAFYGEVRSELLRLLAAR